MSSTMNPMRGSSFKSIPEDSELSDVSMQKTQRTQAPPEGRPASGKQLSATSTQYDVGRKGYLTPSEQKMRSMDTENQGKLSTEQVSEIIKETMTLKNKTRQLRVWAAACFGAVIILAISNLGTAFLAAKLAKDTDVDSSGRMTVKGNKDISVVTVAAGRASVFSLRYDENTGVRYICISQRDATALFSSALDGTENSLQVGDIDNSSFTFGLNAGGSHYNSSHACFGTTRDGDPLCTDFAADLCSDGSQGGRRLQSPQERALAFRKRMIKLRHPARASSTTKRQLFGWGDDDDDDCGGISCERGDPWTQF